MDAIKKFSNAILPTDLSTTSAVVLFSNPNLPTKVIPFLLTGTDAVFHETPEADYTGHIRCQGQGYKLAYKSKEGVSNAKNFTIPVQYIDPAYQVLISDFMAYAPDINNNQIRYINVDIKTLEAKTYTMVNFSNIGAFDATAFVQPTTLTGNGNLNASISIGQIITDALAVSSLFRNSGVSEDAIAKYEHIMEAIERKAILNGMI